MTKLTIDDVMSVFMSVRGPNDKLEETQDTRFVRGLDHDVPAVARITFNHEPHDRIILIHVFEDGVFEVQSSATVSGLGAIQAYGRANALVGQLGLKDA